MDQNYKIILVGDECVGKSVFLKRYLTGEFEKKYIATKGIDIVPLTFNTNHGPITFKVRDHSGRENFDDVRDGHYYDDFQGAIVMFDLTSKMTHINACHLMDNINNVNSNAPIILCGNKCDISKMEVNPRQIRELLPSNVKYYHVSALSNYNFEKPWLDLARQLTGYPDLEFTVVAPISPSYTTVLQKQLLSSLPTPTYKYISMISLPDGGVMKIIHEFYPNKEILKY